MTIYIHLNKYANIGNEWYIKALDDCAYYIHQRDRSTNFIHYKSVKATSNTTQCMSEGAFRSEFRKATKEELCELEFIVDYYVNGLGEGYAIADYVNMRKRQRKIDMLLNLDNMEIVS